MLPLIEHSEFAGAKNQRSANIISYWLLFMCALVALMVIVGGATRLTDSGLSITQWDLIIGALPPLGEEGWLREFEKYKQIPEYERVNLGMSLNEFKGIYWWEWGHRNLGRFIGLAYILPLIWFTLRGHVTSSSLRLKLFGIFILICGQGALGWYMVSSGLVERIDVSQYRLAAHLILALVIFVLMFWIYLNFRMAKDDASLTGTNPKIYHWASQCLLGLVFIQITLGAFVAGLRAGLSYTTWPLMDGRFFPDGYFSVKPHLLDAFETIASVQFNHRMGAYILCLAAIGFWLFMRRAGSIYGKRALWVLGAVVIQSGLGIWTLVSAVPINLGLAHQAGAIAVLMATIYNIYRLPILAR